MANLKSTIVDGAIIHDEGTVAWNETTLTMDLSTGTSFEIDMVNFSNHINVFDVQNATGTVYYKSFLLQIKQHTGSLNFTWSAIDNVKWPGGAAGRPTLTTTNDKKDIYSFTSWDNGSTWYGKVIGQNFS